MGAFVPDQLDQMSKKDLLEFAQTAHEHNVKLMIQLAKANERVKELELALDGLADFLADKNKFAIEQQIKALEWAARNIDIYGAGYGELADKIEQLRKEQE